MLKRMMPLSLSCALFGFAVACSSTEEQPPAASEASESTSGYETPATTEPTQLDSTSSAVPAETVEGAQPMAVQPNAEKLEKHADDHIKYPATREQILEACANTTEFSEGEKQWISQHLPEGTYQSSDDMMKALKTQD